MGTLPDMAQRDIVSTLALDRLAEGVLLVDADGLIVYANDNAAALFCRTKAELLGTPFSLPIQTDGDVEIHIPSPEGRFLTVQMQVVPLDADGQSLSLVSLHDVTSVVEAKRALEVERRALQESNRDLEDFAFAVSHDLQQPLNAITGFLQILETNADGRLTEADKEVIRSAEDGVERMTGMIRGLLEYARVHANGLPMKPVNGRRVMKTALANLNAAITAAGASVTYEPVPTLLGDETQLVSLFQNLIDNGLKYRSADRVPSVSITVDTRDPGQVLIAVQDNGIGIAGEHHRRVFSVFQRLHKDRAYPGTGLGLSLCKRIVDRHGGSIWLESSLGAGTTVYVTLPQYMPTIGSEPSQPVTATGMGREGRLPSDGPSPP